MDKTREPLSTDLERPAGFRALGVLCSVLWILSPNLLYGAPRTEPPEGEADSGGCQTAPDKQKCCGDLLDELEEWFLQGRFDDVDRANLYGGCLKRQLPWKRHPLDRERRIEAFKLLAATHIMLDDVEMARVRVGELLRTDPDFKPDRRDDLPELVHLVEHERPRRAVISVSGAEEDLRQAPATVEVVTGEQIEQRGYLDLESVLHDLPGFDISRGNGLAYSNLYQRGFRSNASDRILFMVDGIEQNDLHSNVAYLSRQYPVSNVDRIEVLYGPASAIYGADAYTGVIHVITRRPTDLVGEGDALSANVQLTSGPFDSRTVEFTLANRVGEKRRQESQLSWSLTGRRYASDEPDLSAFDDWNFALDLGPEAYKHLLRLTGDEARSFDLDRCRGLCERGDVGGEPTVELTDAGAAEAQRLDRLAYTSQSLGGAPIGFSDETENTFLSGRLDIQDFSMGFQLWRREEGTAPWYSDRVRPGARNGSIWIPRNLSIFLDYNRSLGRSLKLTLRARFLQHDLDSDSSVAVLRSYDNGALDLEDLLGADGGVMPYWRRQQLEQLSTQMRTEARAVYTPSQYLELVAGLEIRNSSIQGDFTRLTRECSLPVPECGAGPDEPGTIFDPPFPEREKLTFTDIGFYSQASYLWSRFKFTVGGRLDQNRARERPQRFNLAPTLPCEGDVCLVEEPADFGTVVSPRYAVVYTSSDWVAKAIYSEAFRDPSSVERFTTDGDRVVRNPGLEPERVRNVELAVSWRHDGLAVEAAGYETSYNSIVGLEPIGEELLTALGIDQGVQFGNRGRRTISGFQASAAWKPSGVKFSPGLYANYTYTDPKESLSGPDGDSGDLRISDIASHRFNLGLEASWKDRWHLDLRMSYVGARKVGEGTDTLSTLDEIEAYTVFNSALGYRKVKSGKIFSEALLQVIVNNLFDETYQHPGVQSANLPLVARLPQPGRTVSLRLSTKLRVHARP